MDLSGLEKRIKEREVEIRSSADKLKLLKDLEKYDGLDKIVYFQKLLDVLEEKNKNYKSINLLSGFSKLDSMTKGFKEGQMIVISGPTGQGKSTLVRNLIERFEKQSTISSLFSFENPANEVAYKFGENIPKFTVPMALKSGNLIWLKTRILEAVAKFDARVAFIDHLHYLMDMETISKLNNVSLAIGVTLRKLKEFAIDNRITIFLVSHMKMLKLESEPNIDDLRDSSFVGQEADFVIMMWRMMEKIGKSFENPSGRAFTTKTCLSLVKNRWTGELGKMILSHDKGRFLESENKYSEQTNGNDISFG